MARLFDDALSEYLEINQAVLSGVPLVMACLFKPDVAFTGSLLCLTDKDTNIDSFLLRCLDNNQIEASTIRSTVVYARGGSYGVGSWQHGCAVFADVNNRRIWLNGVSVATNAESRTPINLDRTDVGCHGQSSRGSYVSGDIAEAAIWNLSSWPGATNADKANAFEKIIPSLAKGFSPQLFPLGLVAYWPLVRDLNDRSKGFNLTATGTVVSVHPKVVYPIRPYVPVKRKICYLSGTASAHATASGLMRVTKKLSGFAIALSSVAGSLKVKKKIAGTSAAKSTASATLSVITFKMMSGTALIQSTATGKLRVLYTQIPPFMHKDLIDPYSGGAWLWLVKIAIPGYDVRRIARNTEDIVYGGVNFPKGNLDVGQQSYSGGGSIPQVLLRVMQDPNHELEDIINATQGGAGGTVKLIRTCEKFLDTPVDEWECEFDILTAESDTEWVTFTLGIPSLLTQRIPLRLYSSKICPYAIPALFKGPECQYVGGDGTCTGSYEDCYVKGNAVHWGSELGLDPNALKI